MKKIRIKTESGRSEIITGGNWTDAFELIPKERTVILTDGNVGSIYGKDFPGCPVFTITPGEQSKSLSTIEDLAGRLLMSHADRQGFLLAIGGGVVCDIAGFLASVYMRGIRFGFVSTSLLSQVDASVGGKNGVNLGSIKNIIGTFNQPDFVICDPAMLKSLPHDEYLSGLAELIKMGAILSDPLLHEIECNRDKILGRDIDVMGSLIHESVKLKAGVVAEDEKETGRRMILNFGHTFGHIIEAVSGKKHGLAVAAGMEIAVHISVFEGILDEKGALRLTELLRSFGFTINHDIPVETYTRLLNTDKKKQGEDISFVLLQSPGKAVVAKLPITKLSDHYKIIRDLR